MNKEYLSDDYFWPHDNDKIFDHLNDLKRLWDNHMKDLELIKKWMLLPFTEALSMLMEADALMIRMGNRIEYIKTTEVAFFFIGRLKEMQQQVEILCNFINETRNSLNYKEEEKSRRHFFSRDIPFKRPETLFDGIIPDDFDSDRKWYKPMSIEDYSLVIMHITGGVGKLYSSLERLTSYVLEAKESIEMLTTSYRVTADMERFKLSNLYALKRQDLLGRMSQSFNCNGQEACLKWLKQNELLRLYLETGQVFDSEIDFSVSKNDVSPIIKRRNAIILKAISAGSSKWIEFLTYLCLYYEIMNGLCFNEDNGFAIVDDIEASLHPKLQKEIYESYIRLHPEKDNSSQDKHVHFPHCLDREKGNELFKFLIKGAYIDSKTDEESFLFLMGCTYGQPNELKLIKWLKNKQLLREMLEQIFHSSVDNKSLRIVDIERLTPLCFMNRDGNSLILAKRKFIFSIDSDNLKDKIATIMRPQ